MNVHISYRVHRTPDVEKEINHLIEKLRKRLQVFRPELVHLKGNIEQNSPREGIIVSFNLRLPSGQMAVQESASTAPAAIKAAVDDLLQQITKHKDLLRSSHKWRRRRAEKARPEPQVPFEQTIAAMQPQFVSSDDIRSYVNANLSRLDRFVERELVFRENAGQISENSITKDEMITLVQFALEGAKPRDREAFILQAIEGFSIDEIAAITDRKPEEIRTSIAAARAQLRRSPPIANRFKDKLLQNTGTV